MTNPSEPSTFAQLHSEKLAAHIRDEIEVAQGHVIDFARFMQLCLYAPGLGYYSAGTHKFGRGGDFVTAPEISPLFARCLARQFQQIFDLCGRKMILEVGAGSGIFARDVLLALHQAGVLPDHYFILEISAELRERQLQRFQVEIPQFLSRIVWLDELPTSPFDGVIFANEVLDAMPVHRFEWRAGEVSECCVAVERGTFVWRNKPADLELKNRVLAIADECSLPDIYRSEISFFQSAWIQSMATVLRCGLLLLVDYGYGRREYYHPERVDGTLMCFYQHKKEVDPLLRVGLQDMTAHVDFTAIAESAHEAGLEVAGFTTQAGFLLGCGLLGLAEAVELDEAARYEQNQAIKTLMLPSQMGEVVKVMALTKNVDWAATAFDLQNRVQDL